jgi:3-oxoacyl-[acyl-carrier protein] reductase
MPRGLTDRVAIITGAAGGIGFGIARTLAGHGVKTVLWDRDFTRFDALADKPAHLACRAVDVTDAEDVARAFGEAVELSGGVDILVNNAGINGPVVALPDYPLDDWNRVVAVNLNGVFHGCRVAVPHMTARGYGRILNVASIAGKEGVQFISAYSAAKAGVIAMSKSLAKEIAATGVTVNCLAPAIVETELFREMTPEHIAASRAKIPMGRFLQVGEIADMAAWIVSEECSFTSGFTFDLTGGRATY